MTPAVPRPLVTPVTWMRVAGLEDVGDASSAPTAGRLVALEAELVQHAEAPRCRPS